MNKLGIYVHVPFCIQKCRYCDFYSLSIGNDAVYARYRDALIRHFALISKTNATYGYTVDSIYFGGGTPSILPAEILCDILDAIRNYFQVANDCEITLEMNPKTASFHALERYWQSGFNRLSIGCQSADEKELKMLGRLHTFGDFCETVRMARNAGFHNINADLMLGLPSQDWRMLSDSIEKISEQEPTHISVYGLKVEEDTWFGKHKSEFSLPDEDTESELYLRAVDRLAALGYGQYEISNFCKSGYASRHNLKYWHGESYLGFGPAAYSYFKDHRYGYSRDLLAYISATEEADFTSVIRDEEFLSPSDIREEKLMLGLRLTEGIFLTDYGFDESVIAYLEKLKQNGMVHLSGMHLSLTPRGMLVDNYITSELLLHI